MRILIGFIFIISISKLIELSSELENKTVSSLLAVLIFTILAFVVGNGLTNLY